MTRSRTLTLLLVAGCALALGLAACGGDDSEASGESSPAPPSVPAPPSEPTDPPETVTDPADPEPPEPSGTDTPPEPGTPDTPAIGDNVVPTPTSVPAGAIAIVGDVTVEQAEFDLLISQREQTTVNQGGEFPAVGTPDYETVKNQLVDFLVQREQYAQEAAAVGVEVTDAEVIARLDELREQFFEGDEARYLEELANQGLSEEQVLADLRFQQVTDKLFERVTEGIAISDADIQTYYDENPDNFATPESREVAHILVETKQEADKIKADLDAGGDFAKLAKDNSIDEGTAVNGGAYTAVRGLSVPEFDEAAYALATGDISDPVKTTFGFHIIQAVEDATPATVQPLDEVRDQIESLLSRDIETEMVDAWLAALQDKYEGKVLYAPGFEPPPSVVDDPPADSGEEGTEGQTP